ncbi:MAG: HD domain-containing protein [Chloroflexi bacterium]|nr:HD domain-containing protein [Chloroflexota bacterium]
MASDLAVGLHAGHGVRSCYIGMRLAEALELPLEQRVHLYYAELLKDAGCTAYTSQLAGFLMVDELAAKRDLQFFRNVQNPIDVFSWLLQYVAQGAPFPTRVARIKDYLVNGRAFWREGFESTCQVAKRIAERLGMPPPVQDALLQIFEQWDGKGMPYGTRGEAIPIISRIVLTTSFLEVFHRRAGRDAALRVAGDQSRKSFDPLVVDAFLSLADDEHFWSGLEDERVSDIVLSMEPEESSYRYIREEQLEDVAQALADYADMKSPYLAGRSRRVAELAERVARRMGLPEPEATHIYRAALVRDIGIVAVPSFVLNKPQDQLSEVEREQIRLHPYHSERILSKVPALAPIVPIVSAHHERMDGRGYHRGLTGEKIPRGARILAVTDQFDELTHDAPDHPAMEPEEALDLMNHDVGNGLWPEAFQALVEELGGAARPPAKARRQQWPAGLTDREVEVLRLAAKGLSRRQIGDRLIVTEGTVRSHLEHIYGKIGVSTRATASLFAMEHGLLE